MEGQPPTRKDSRKKFRDLILTVEGAQKCPKQLMMLVKSAEFLGTVVLKTCLF